MTKDKTICFKCLKSKLVNSGFGEVLGMERWQEEDIDALVLDALKDKSTPICENCDYKLEVTVLGIDYEGQS